MSRSNESSIELDGSLVKMNSRRYHHSLGNALWHTVSIIIPSEQHPWVLTNLGLLISPTTIQVFHTAFSWESGRRRIVDPFCRHTSCLQWPISSEKRRDWKPRCWTRVSHLLRDVPVSKANFIQSLAFPKTRLTGCIWKSSSSWTGSQATGLPPSRSNSTRRAKDIVPGGACQTDRRQRYRGEPTAHLGVDRTLYTVKSESKSAIIYQPPRLTWAVCLQHGVAVWRGYGLVG